MQQNFDAALACVLRHEGGYVDHPLDPGGATNRGVTRATLAGVRGRPVSKAEVMALSLGETAGDLPPPLLGGGAAATTCRPASTSPSSTSP